jgi:hypothetical protein
MLSARLLFPGDDRLYEDFRPAPGERLKTRCLNEERQPNGEIWKCGFSVRKDSLKPGHKCNFHPPEKPARGQLRLDALQDRQQSRTLSPLAEELAIFLAKANIAVNAAYHADLEGFLKRVFLEGWNAAMRSTATGSPPSAAVAAAQLVPKCNRAALSRALETVNDRHRRDLIRIFREYRYVGLSLDGVGIGQRKFLNLDIVCALANTLPFTFDFLSNSRFKTPAFVAALSRSLDEMSAAGLTLAGVTSDGCRFQVKGLNWRSEKSIQRTLPQYARLLRVPCACHRMQLALNDLFALNGTYQSLISEVHEAATLLRKPDYQDMMGATCPTHCPTRWVYDFRIVSFLVERFDAASAALAGVLDLDPRIPELLPLLDAVFRTMGELEADDAPLALVFPALRRLFIFLEQQHEDLSSGVCELYDHFCEIATERLLDSTDCLFHLAFVLTPLGRAFARQEICDFPPEFREYDDDFLQELVPDDLEMDGTSFPVAQPVPRVRAEPPRHPPVFASFSASDDEDLVPELEEEPMQPDTGEGGDPDTGELADQETEGGAAPEFLVRDGSSRHLPTLFAHAEMGLREILDQFSVGYGGPHSGCYISPEQVQETLAAFQEFVATAPSDLALKGNFTTNRFPWGILSPPSEGWGILTDIALRIEALVCNEAVSERTNSAMKRLLAPFRLKMGRGVLLSRLTLARHGGVPPTPA